MYGYLPLASTLASILMSSCSSVEELFRDIGLTYVFSHCLLNYFLGVRKITLICVETLTTYKLRNESLGPFMIH